MVARLDKVDDSTPVGLSILVVIKEGGLSLDCSGRGLSVLSRLY